MDEPTRIIPLNSHLSGRQVSNIIRMEPDPGMIQVNIEQGKEVVMGGNDSESAQRFASEVKYVGYFAAKLTEILGMHQLQMGVVEDREGQTTFASSAKGWHGAVSSNRKSLKHLRESFARD